MCICNMVGIWNVQTTMFSVRLYPGIAWLQKKRSAHYLSIKLLISNSHGSSMYALSMVRLDFFFHLELNFKILTR